MNVLLGVFVSNRQERIDFLFPRDRECNTVDGIEHSAYEQLVHLYGVVIRLM